MDFGRSADEQAFADEVCAFLRAHPPETFPADGTDAGYGSGAHSRAFLRALGERGFISLSWPREHGGLARPMAYRLLLLEELAAAGAPFGPLPGCLQVGDAIIRHGSETLRRELLPRVARGEATFWQGYSEPGAGSDLLALETRARLEGEHWILDGRKIWSSHAGVATHGTVLARTEPASTRQRAASSAVGIARSASTSATPSSATTCRQRAGMWPCASSASNWRGVGAMLSGVPQRSAARALRSLLAAGRLLRRSGDSSAGLPRDRTPSRRRRSSALSSISRVLTPGQPRLGVCSGGIMPRSIIRRRSSRSNSFAL